ncbi:PAS domain S-box [Burkholderiales bacterium JOSHI_001]|nr:PAS domain S-box [Burkholderiales bacterium JOSHI_001]
MLAYWDRDLRCLFANRAYETWFGADPDRLVGTALQDLLGPDLFALNEPFILAALRGEEQTFERVVPGPEGIDRHSLANYQPDVIDGHVVGFIVSVTEVTQLKRTEANLRSAISTLQDEIHRRRGVEDRLIDIQQSLAVSLASIDAGFIATDRQGRVTQMNAVSERLTGWLQAEALGRQLWDVFAREGREASMLSNNPVDLVADQGLTVDDVHNVVAIARDGTRTPIEVKVALTCGEDGQERGLAMVLRDRTRTLQAEVDASRLAAIVESSNDAIISKTLDGRITSWNSAAKALFGYEANEAIGQSVQMLIPRDRQDEEMRILVNLDQGVRVPAFDTVRRAKDGHLIEVSLTISPIRDADGTIVGASKIVRDITQRRQAEQARLKIEQMEAENRQIQQANRFKSQFLANMSHELRTPLNAIIGFSDLMLAGKVSPGSPKHRSWLGHISASGHHLLQLINDILDLSKVESGKFEFFPEPVDLPRLLKEIGDVLHAGIERKGISIRAELDPQLDAIVLDHARLKQVLYNYLSNAIKFTPNAGCITVRVTADDEEHILVEVEDTGIGIAADQLPRLFMEFEQIDAGRNKQHQGAGLGLALTRRLVEAQGGSVGVRSETGKGSVFFARLNRIHGTDATRAKAGDRPEPDARTHRLLVIEDDPHLQARLVEGLLGAGYGVEAASSAAQAVRLALGARFDGLTLDLLLADCSGLGLLSDIRNEGNSARARVMGVTVPVHGSGAASFAVADILSKPLRSGDLALAMATFRGPNGATTRVMVIDDDPMALDLMHAALADVGVEAVCLQDGRQALREIDKHQPQAIILDLMMPEFDGFAVLDALHQLPEWWDTPVFIWTSMMLTDDEYASLASSARTIVSKGGGDLMAMLERLKRCQPSVSA